MNCPKCNAEVDESKQYCPECGKKLKKKKLSLFGKVVIIICSIFLACILAGVGMYIYTDIQAERAYKQSDAYKELSRLHEESEESYKEMEESQKETDELIEYYKSKGIID
jgi:predicted amidophosphoribosyltransferase